MAGRQRETHVCAVGGADTVNRMQPCVEKSVQVADTHADFELFMSVSVGRKLNSLAFITDFLLAGTQRGCWGLLGTDV